MTILDDTRSILAGQKDKLQAERDRLVGERDKLTAQIGEIDALLRQIAGLGAQRPPRATSTSGRRSGIRDQIFALVQSTPGGMKPADVRTALGLTDKSGSQSVSNTLSALTRGPNAKLIRDATGAYKAA